MSVSNRGAAQRIGCLGAALGLVLLAGCSDSSSPTSGATEPPESTTRPAIALAESTIRINRIEYAERLHGFWLGQSIGNWTGLVTEMDKIGGPGPAGQFYTREDWGGPDQPAIWSDQPSELSETIDFVFRGPDEVWGADDDTDIEYMYQHALAETQTSLLTPDQIRAAWLTHIYDQTQPTPYGSDEGGYQNYLWVSNQRAHELMLAGHRPPETSDPDLNPHWEMIDAQLTTEIFGLFAPGHPEAALRLAALPIRTTARGEAALAAEFYVILHALAAATPMQAPPKETLFKLAAEARAHLPDESYTAAMYDFVSANYAAGVPWEATRDQLYERYQVQQADGYDMTGRGLYCNGCFASGINFGASLISFFYGEGDLQETVKIATLCGWDSDNPAASWGGLLGFMMGKQGVEAAFDRKFSSRFNIHRTRKGFANAGMDDFDAMAARGVAVTDRAVREVLGGRLVGEVWVIPAPSER